MTKARVVEKVASMNEFFSKFEFGRVLAKHTKSTGKTFQGQKIYRVQNDMLKRYNLHKGDYIYLDAKHRDHLEVFKNNKISKTVLNLNGAENIAKKNKAANRILNV